MFCTKCGKEMRGGYIFCPSCGTRIGEKAVCVSSGKKNICTFIMALSMLFFVFTPFYKVIRQDVYEGWTISVSQANSSLSAFNLVKDFLFDDEINEGGIFLFFSDYFVEDIMNDSNLLIVLSGICVVGLSVIVAFVAFDYLKDLCFNRRACRENIERISVYMTAFVVATIVFSRLCVKAVGEYYDYSAEYSTNIFLWILFLVALANRIVILKLYLIECEAEERAAEIGKAKCGEEEIHMFCSKCGKEILNGQMFCPQCGHEFGKKSSNTVIERTGINQGDNSKLIRIVCVVAAVVVVAFFINRQNMEKKIIGEWRLTEDSYRMNTTNWEFWEDGSVRKIAVYGTYKIDGDKLSIHIMSALAGYYFEEYTISFKGDLMYLQGEDGSYGYYERETQAWLE